MVEDGALELNLLMEVDQGLAHGGDAVTQIVNHEYLKGGEEMNLPYVCRLVMALY